MFERLSLDQLLNEIATEPNPGTSTNQLNYSTNDPKGSNMQDHILLSKHVKSVVSQEGAFLLDGHSTYCFLLNEFGARLWERLERGDSLQSIVVSVSSHYQKPEEEVRKDVDGFINALIERGLATTR